MWSVILTYKTKQSRCESSLLCNLLEEGFKWTEIPGVNFPILLLPLSALVLNELDQTTTEVETQNFNIFYTFQTKRRLSHRSTQGNLDFIASQLFIGDVGRRLFRKGFKEKILSNKCHTLLQSQYLFLAMMSGFYWIHFKFEWFYNI